MCGKSAESFVQLKNMSKPLSYKILSIMFVVAVLSVFIHGQQQTKSSLRGQINDQQNAVIVGATVEAIDSNGTAVTVVTNDQGEFSFENLAPGRYTVRASQAGFAAYENPAVDVTAASKSQLKITLNVAVNAETVTVAAEPPVSTEPTNNAGALVIKGGDIDALPDNPEDLQAALQAMAGPGAGPSGGEIYIDGFTDGRMPPKSSIREIRINSNPFSAEYDRIGFGRIEILTKPGTSTFHGQAFFNFNDESLNSRNPFAGERDSYQSRQFGGNVSGSLNKRSSYFFDFERRSIDDLAVINANILNSNLNVTSFSQSVQTPLTRTTFSPRFDFQLNDTNTLTARYGFTRTGADNAGIGGFSLPSRAYNTSATEHNLQLSDTAIINKSIINETRFQFLNRKSENSSGDTTLPTIQVLDAFTTGGANVGNSSSDTKRFELANNTSWTYGNHSLKAGARLRSISINDVSRNNFAGTYTFTSLDQYRNTLLGLNGATPTQFTLTSGNPQAKISQLDFGVFGQDDWRVRPNLTVNLGLRYEAQTNVSNNLNFAPRLGFAWSPDSAGGKNGKTVVRGGFGVFFDRIGESLSLAANRYNGSNLQSFVVTDPSLLALYPAVPTVSTLLAYATTQNTYRLADDIRAPYNLQTNIGIERQLPYNFTVSANYVNTRGFNQLRARNVNAPLDGVRPFGDVGNILQYETTGRYEQNQLMFNVRNRFGSKFSLFAMYTLGNAKGDTDGSGSFPAYSYDLSGEYGRASTDVRHRLVLGGSVSMPFGFSLNPFVIVSSGQPFNITTGQDTNGDSLFTERPTYARLNARCTALALTNSFCDMSGVSDINAIIPRNYGTGPAFATVNLRLSKTFGFGGESSGGSGFGGGMGGPGGPGGPPPSASSSKRYNLTFSLQAQNLLNNVNAGTPVGNLSSTLFGQSNSLGGSFGFGPPGMSSSSAAYNRRIEAQIRFSF